MAAFLPVDVRSARFNQGAAATLLLAAFVVNRPLLVAGVAVELLVGAALGPAYSLFCTLHARLIQPRLGRPRALEDAFRFRIVAAGEGLALGAATVAFLADSIDVAWAMTIGVAILAGLSSASEVYEGREISGPTSPRATGHDREELPTPPAPDLPPIRPWRARWVGMRTLRQWVTITGQTSTGEVIVRAGSDRLLLPHGATRFWPSPTCGRCHAQTTAIDASRRQKALLCADCDAQ